MDKQTIKFGRRGTVVIPAEIRRTYRFEEGSPIIVETRPDGVLLRPVLVLPIEKYTPERKAEFLLNNAVTAEDYEQAVKEIRDMGLDPENILHKKLKRPKNG